MIEEFTVELNASLFIHPSSSLARIITVTSIAEVPASWKPSSCLSSFQMGNARYTHDDTRALSKYTFHSKKR